MTLPSVDTLLTSVVALGPSTATGLVFAQATIASESGLAPSAAGSPWFPIIGSTVAGVLTLVALRMRLAHAERASIRSGELAKAKGQIAALESQIDKSRAEFNEAAEKLRDQHKGDLDQARGREAMLIELLERVKGGIDGRESDLPGDGKASSDAHGQKGHDQERGGAPSQN